MQTKQSITVKDMTQIAMFAIIMVISAWITIPMTIPFTLETFAVFLSVGLLGGKKATLAVILHLLLGVIGLPVFSGFRGGVGVLLGTTGGYLLGFVLIAATAWIMEILFGKKTWILLCSLILGLFICYAFGTFWFQYLYARSTGSIGIMTVLGWCVFPFIIPDFVKLAVALALSDRLKKVLKL